MPQQITNSILGCEAAKVKVVVKQPALYIFECQWQFTIMT